MTLPRPHDTVVTALLDAVATGPVLPSGGIDRTAVEQARTVASIADNLAMQRYQQDHPRAVHGDGARSNALEEGRRLLAVEGTTWLIERGYLTLVDEHSLALTKPFTPKDGKRYKPGHDREEDLFHSIRRPTPGRLDLLRQSIATFGDLREWFPVLLDEDGNVVDGRHRRALDQEWPEARARVPRDIRVSVAVVANRVNAWTAQDWQRLRVHAEFQMGKQAANRELIRMALREDASRSDRQIASLVGCDHKTVADVKAENFEEGGEIPHPTQSSAQREVDPDSSYGRLRQAYVDHGELTSDEAAAVVSERHPDDHPDDAARRGLAGNTRKVLKSQRGWLEETGEKRKGGARVLRLTDAGRAGVIPSRTTSPTASTSRSTTTTTTTSTEDPPTESEQAEPFACDHKYVTCRDCGLELP